MFTNYIATAVAALLTIFTFAMSKETSQNQSSSRDDECTHIPVNVPFVPNVGTSGFCRKLKKMAKDGHESGREHILV